MSSFIDGMVKLLPEHNNLHDSMNPLRRVLETSLGVWFDNRNIQGFYDNLFLNLATGEWLDLHGRDYGVIRQEDESDEDYRIRIVQDTLEHLTPSFLDSVYDLPVYVKVASYDPEDNMLTSDNPWINKDGYMSTAGVDVQARLNSKFILGGGLSWF